MTYSKHIVRSSQVVQSPRLAQVLGMFDVPEATASVVEWDVDLTLPERWNVGVIVGPSGCGKSTVGRELFGQWFKPEPQWDPSRSIIDGFPVRIPVKAVTDLLCSVGFSSPPSWVRPFNALSTGQQFRVNLARTLADAMVDQQPRVVDEYSSVVDRTVARIGSAAVARTVRKRNLQFVAITCHYDVLDWLCPDWVYEPHTNTCRINDTDAERGLLRRRPPIEMEIVRTDTSAWQLFKPHHYLSSSLHKSAACYVALIDDQPAAFTAVLPFPHAVSPGYREHRTVCLPDFQGVGIGNALSEYVASIYKATGKPYTSTTSHPAMIYHRSRSALWKVTRKPGLTAPAGRRQHLMKKTTAVDRITASFAYVGRGASC